MRLILGISILACYLLIPTEGYITWIEKRYPLPGNPSPPGSPWPMPQEWLKTSVLLTIHPDDFHITTSPNVENCDVIQEAVKRYRSYIIPANSSMPPEDFPFLHFVHLNVVEANCSAIVPGMIDEPEAEKWNEGGRSVYKTMAAFNEINGEFHSMDLDGALLSTVEQSRTFQCTIYSKAGARGVEPKQDSITVVADGNCSHVHEDDVGNRGHADILANTVWGALRGLETLAQLVWETKNGSDAMEWNKMNVFHWHIVDDQSFPFESKVFPNLTTEGAYTPKHIYTQEDIKKVINYARLRGIRVILEFDTPGHTMGFGQAFPELLTPCYGEMDENGDLIRGTANLSVPHSDYEILDPTNNFTYLFMEEFFKEVKTVNEDDYIHLGMDEVYYGCWRSSPVIKQFMDEHNYTEIKEVEQHYVRWMTKMVQDLGFKYITWQDPVDNGVVMAPDTIIHVWKDTSLDNSMGKWQDYIANVSSKGYKIILSACWYLNYVSYGQDWKNYYECDPRNFNGPEHEKDLVIGGEACLWGEYVDGTNLLPRMWPRASAVAERLWSSQEVNNTDDAAFRLDEQRCRMVRRGIPAQPILNGFCGEFGYWPLNPQPPQNETETTTIVDDQFTFASQPATKPEVPDPATEPETTLETTTPEAEEIKPQPNDDNNGVVGTVSAQTNFCAVAAVVIVVVWVQKCLYG